MSRSVPGTVGVFALVGIPSTLAWGGKILKLQRHYYNPEILERKRKEFHTTRGL